MNPKEEEEWNTTPCRLLTLRLLWVPKSDQCISALDGTLDEDTSTTYKNTFHGRDEEKKEDEELEDIFENLLLRVDEYVHACTDA